MRTPRSAARPGRVAAALTLAAALVLTACGRGGQTAGGAGADAPSEGPQLSATVTAPAPDATDVPLTTGITFTTENAEKATVDVTDEAGKAVKGKLGEDGLSWRPSSALDWGTTYDVTVTVTGADGATGTGSSSFTTMPEPEKQVRITSFLGDGQVVGVGMPIIIRFGRDIPAELRDEVQRRMTVTADPEQPGTWHWFSASEVHFRPKEFWAAHSEISAKIDLRGVPMGDGWYGGTDLTLDIETGPAVILTVDNATKSMTVRRDGQVLRTIPVSLGKKKTPSSYGTMVIMEKYRKTVFDTREELGPEEGYRTDIEYAQRLTHGGEFIHAAPWSVADQGKRNVSHGCVNVSMADAKWLFEITRQGDPVTVKGTEVKLRYGNGWTDWDMSWSDWVDGSALPYEGD